MPSGLDVRPLTSGEGQLTVLEEEGGSVVLPPQLYSQATRVASVLYSDLRGLLPDTLPGHK